LTAPSISFENTKGINAAFHGRSNPSPPGSLGDTPTITPGARIRTESRSAVSANKFHSALWAGPWRPLAHCRSKFFPELVSVQFRLASIRADLRRKTFCKWLRAYPTDTLIYFAERRVTLFRFVLKATSPRTVTSMPWMMLRPKFLRTIETHWRRIPSRFDAAIE
jgi:hypothetical protein